MSKIPDWIRLLPLGEVALSDGRQGFHTDRAVLEDLVQQFQGRGIDLVVDYEHETLGGTRAPAAGWIKELQARDDGLWGRVEWTAQASQYLSQKEYRYFSPVLRLDPKTRRPLALLHVALTNVPAIDHLPPLVAREAPEKEWAVLEALNDARAAQEARAKKWGIGVKDGGHVTKPGEWAAVPDEQFADPVNYRYPMPDREQCQAAWSYWNQEKNQRQYTPEERGKITARIKARAQAVGMQIAEEAKPMKEKLSKLLALKAEATEEEILAAVGDKLQLITGYGEICQALGLDGTAGSSLIIGRIAVFKAAAENAEADRKELLALKQEQAKERAEGMIVEALRTGRTSPEELDRNNGLIRTLALRDGEMFKTMILDRPVGSVVPIEKLPKQPDDKTNDGGLTPEEAAVCKSLGVTAEAFKAEQKRQAEQAG